MNPRTPLCVGVLSALLAACAREAPPPAVPDRVERFGALELVVHTRSFRSANGDGWGSTHSGSLRWQGQPLEVPTRGGLFGDQPAQARSVNAAFVLVRGALPELIVNVGDPNNTSAFHALRQQDGRLAMPLLCLSLAGDNSVQWLDAPGPPRVFAGPQFQVLEGGRRLLLGSRCLYDVAERRAWRVPQAPGLAVWAVPPLGVSPDGRRLVRFGSVDGVLDDAGQPAHHLLLATLEDAATAAPETGAAPAGRWQALRIDRTRMRYAHESQLDAAWLAHHFAWQRGADGQERLVERAGFLPLPHRGWVMDTGGSGEYRLPLAQRDMRPALFALLRTRFGGSLKSVTLDGDSTSQAAVRGETLVMTPTSFWVESGKPYVAGQPGDPALQRALVRELAAAFDGELAAGRHAELFEPPR